MSSVERHGDFLFFEFVGQQLAVYMALPITLPAALISRGVVNKWIPGAVQVSAEKKWIVVFP
jgi:hypothetical protein